MQEASLVIEETDAGQFLGGNAIEDIPLIGAFNNLGASDYHDDDIEMKSVNSVTSVEAHYNEQVGHDSNVAKTADHAVDNLEDGSCGNELQGDDTVNSAEGAFSEGGKLCDGAKGDVRSFAINAAIAPVDDCQDVPDDYSVEKARREEEL